MTHRQAVSIFVLATFLWSIAGPITKLLESAKSFEVTMWRSIFAALTVLAITYWRGGAQRGFTQIWRQIRAGGTYAIVSGFMWAIMFCCFMIALTLTTTANVLLTQCVGPILTALLSWAVFKRAIKLRTWIVIAVTCAAIAAMYIRDVSGLGGQHTLGVLVAFGIPCAAAINWVIQQHASQDGKQAIDLTTSVMLGGIISALVMLPLALPFEASAHDISLLAFLGVFQLGIPCALVVGVMNRMAAHEASLLSLLEVVFGIALAWIFSNARPGNTTLVCGAIVIAALVYNELSDQSQ
jgi:drug/metabolite transporter (DMT)-like permease